MGSVPMVRERAPTGPYLQARTHNLLGSPIPRLQGAQMTDNIPPAKRTSDQPKSEGRPKWVPMRDDQYGGLTALARDLMDARTRKGGGRITENTLIRVGIDLLLAHPELLVGDTEEELRANALAYIARLQAPPQQNEGRDE